MTVYENFITHSTDKILFQIYKDILENKKKSTMQKIKSSCQKKKKGTTWFLNHMKSCSTYQNQLYINKQLKKLILK
jgi:hypothetical protein